MNSSVDKELLSRALDTAWDAVVFEDEEGRILLWNRGAEYLYGFKADQVVGRVVEGLNTRSVRARLSGSDEEKMPILISQECEDGSLVQVWLRSGAVKDEHGRLLAYQHCGRRVQDTLDFLESAPNAVLIVNEDGALEHVNIAAVDLFGYGRDEMLSMTVDSLLPPRYREKHKDYRRAFHRDPLARPMGTGRDLFGLRHDGQEFPVEVALQPLSLGRIMVTIVDLTQRVAAEQRFRLAVKAAPCGMLMIDAEGRITLVNSQAEEIFGYQRSELLGLSIDSLVPERYREDHSRFRARFNQTPVARQMGAGADLVGMRKDGSEVPVEIGLNPIATNEGNFVLASVIDSTPRRRATEELRASLRDKELLLQEIHHRVKNNLAVIGSILFLQSSTTNDPELLRVLQECQERVRSMSLVHERLYLTGDLGKLDFSDYIRELAQQLARNNVLTGQRVSLHFQLDNLPLDLKQAVPCGLILNELLTNAFKHAFQGRAEGAVSVSLQRSTLGRILMVVTDDGNGHRSAELERNGSLGLRLVRSLTRQLDGEFNLEHSSDGGTRALLQFEEMEEHRNE